MNEYKRLTSRYSDGTAVKKCVLDCRAPACDICLMDDKIIKRLAELEDKLESGMLVELPCKVGDIIYIPWIWDGTSDVMKLTVNEVNIYATTIAFSCYDFETDLIEFARKFNNGIFDIHDFGTVWFTTLESAKARLKELQEEEECWEKSIKML